MPRTTSLPVTVALAVALLLCPFAPTTSSAQQAASAPDPGLVRGIELYKRGDVKGAVQEFRSAVKRRKDDPAAWLYLGQALVRRGELKDARKAFDVALKLKPDFAAAHSSLAYLLLISEKPREAESEATKALALDRGLADAHYVLGLLRLREGAWLKAIEEADTIIKLNADIPVAYSLKTQALLGLYERGNVVLADERRGAYDFDEATIREAHAAQPLRLKEAAESLERYIRLSPSAEDIDELREQLETLRFYAESATTTDPARRIYGTADGITRATITFKPEPGYTEEARRAGIRGVVRLRVVLGADGQVKHIIVLRRLSHGLTEKAVAAARRMKFRPATLNGLPVSQFVVLEYNFNIY